MSKSTNSNAVTIFRPYIIEKLRRANPFMDAATDESDAVLGGAVVHIPQAGDSPTVVKNRTTYPATAVQRGDSHVTYALNVYTTTPTHVTWEEVNEQNYDKTDSVLNDHVATLAEATGDMMLQEWVQGANSSGTTETLPVARRIATTGDAVAATETGQTGTRKALTYKELQAAQARMDKDNVPKIDRYILIESFMMQQFIDSLSANQMAAFQQSADLENGVVGKFAGFKVMERSKVLAFDSSNALKDPTEAIEAADNLACLAWQKASVAKALGETKPFQDTDSPTYYGDIFSALVKSGGRCRRADWKGVIAIVQAAPAAP